MKRTLHAERRMEQRGIPVKALELVEMLGFPVQSDSEGLRLVIPDKVISEMIELLSRCRNTVFVTDRKACRLITAYRVGKGKKVLRDRRSVVPGWSL